MELMTNIVAQQAGQTPTVLVIMGSTRAGRRCPEIAAWVLDIARASVNFDFRLVDLREWPLPCDDEPKIPASGAYVQEHTRAWSQTVSDARGYIIVTPQYNWGYPAPLKNALDHVYKEWNGKPIAIVTYGGHGGVKCGLQLKQVTEGMRMQPLPTMPAITLTHEMIGGGAIDASRDFELYAESIRQVVTELTSAIKAGQPSGDARK
jgi:NAD(P)H-dependent FMN reductase